MLERRHREGLRIYPILIENCLWKTHSWLEAMNVRPEKALMQQSLGKRNDIMVEIGEEIRDLLADRKDKGRDGLDAEVSEAASDHDSQTVLTSKPMAPNAGAGATPVVRAWGTPFELDDHQESPAQSHTTTIATPAPTPPALISIPEPPIWPESLGIPVPDSFLLKPESRVVPFLAEAVGWRDEIFGWACRNDHPLKLRLQAGRGGTGKTRLAIDVCETLANDGWFAGFLAATHGPDDIERQLPQLLAPGRDCLIVIDYAETRAEVVVTLARALLYAASRNAEPDGKSPRFRILMLAREGGDWFHYLADKATRASDDALKALLNAGVTKSGPHRMSLRPIQPNERRRIFSDAVEAFAARTGLLADGISPPDLSVEPFSRVLMIQIAALAALREETIGADQDLLANTLGHERSYWRRLLRLGSDAHDGPLHTLEQALALFTMLGGRDSDSAAKVVIKRVPRLQNSEPDTRLLIFDRLRQFYPNRKEGEDDHATGIKGLEPDLLGERLVAECLARDDELLDAALDPQRRATSEEASACFTVLARLAMQRESDEIWLRRALERYFGNWPKEILAVAMETGGPIGDLMVEATREVDTKTRRFIVRQVKGDLPEETTNLKNFSIEIAERLTNPQKADGEFKKSTRGDLSKRLQALSTLAIRYTHSGRLLEAAEVQEQAVSVAEWLSKKGKPDNLLQLATARVRLSSSLNQIGRFPEALKQASEAERIALDIEWFFTDRSRWTQCLVNSLAAHATALRNNGRFKDALEKQIQAVNFHRKLAKPTTANTNEYEANLLGDLSSMHQGVGEFEDALDTTTRAEIISRRLSDANADDYRYLLAKTHNKRSMYSNSLGNFESALKDSEAAETLYAELADQQPDVYAGVWADSFNNLGLRRRDLGDFDGALKAIRRAEFIRRELAARQPEAHRFDWVINLANLGEALLNTTDFTEAIEVTEKAINLLPSLPARPGEDNQRIAPGFCRRVLAEAQLGADEPAVALAVAEEGCVNLRDAFAARPDHVAEHYVQGLATLAKCHRALQDDQKAIGVLAEGIVGVTPIFMKRPRALQREMLRLIEPLEAIDEAAADRHIPDQIRTELAQLPELARGAAGL